MNGEDLAILSVNLHSKDGDHERYAVTLTLPGLPAALGPPLQEVSPTQRQDIDDRVRQVTVKLSHSEWFGEVDQLDDLRRKLKGLGRLLCTTFIPAGISEALKGLSVPLVICTELNNVPWELLHLGDDNFLALKVPFVRLTAVDYKPGAIAELRADRQQPVCTLLACNPGQPPLAAVREELDILNGLLRSSAVVVKRMGVEPWDYLELLGGLADRQFAVVHFTGHAHFDTVDPAHSYIKVLSGDGVERPVTAEQLYQNIAGAPFVFLNACESARESSAAGDFLYLAERTKGFATCVIAGGAIAYVGAQWPVLDLSAALFAAAFYQPLLAGDPVGKAMLIARQACANGELPDELKALLPDNIILDAPISQVTWANFVLYGEPHKRFL